MLRTPASRNEMWLSAPEGETIDGQRGHDDSAEHRPVDRGRSKLHASASAIMLSRGVLDERLPHENGVDPGSVCDNLPGCLQEATGTGPYFASTHEPGPKPGAASAIGSQVSAFCLADRITGRSAQLAPPSGR